VSASIFPPPSRPRNDSAELRQRLQQQKHPGLSKSPSRSLEDHCDDRATAAFRVALAKWGEDENSIRSFARRIGRSERMVRDYRDGLRSVPAWVLLAFPRDARFDGLEELTSMLSEIEAACG
jgi:hypothetical protein